MNKKKLQELVCWQLYETHEAIRLLGWKTEHEENDERGTGVVTCSCGKEVEMSGLFWVNFVKCTDCEKHMQDVTGIFRLSNSTAGFLIDPDLYEYPQDYRVWIVYK